MASAVRIERCPDQNAATQRQVALTALGFKVEVIVGDATVVTSEIAMVNGKATLNDKLLWPTAPFVVVGVLP